MSKVKYFQQLVARHPVMCRYTVQYRPKRAELQRTVARDCLLMLTTMLGSYSNMRTSLANGHIT